MSGLRSLLKSRKFWLTMIGCAATIAIAIVSHVSAIDLIHVIAAQLGALVLAIAIDRPVVVAPDAVAVPPVIEIGGPS